MKFPRSETPKQGIADRKAVAIVKKTVRSRRSLARSRAVQWWLANERKREAGSLVPLRATRSASVSSFQLPRLSDLHNLKPSFALRNNKGDKKL